MFNGSVVSLKLGERGGRSVLINVKHVFLSSLCNSLIYMYIIHTLYACMISYNSPYSTMYIFGARPIKDII